jgi:hypothetical protein
VRAAREQRVSWTAVLSLIVFPGLWSGFFLAVCPSNDRSLSGAIASTYAFSIGTVTYLSMHGRRTLGSPFGLLRLLGGVLAIFAISTTFWAHHAITWDPIGEGADAGWQPWIKEDHAYSNGQGEIASIRFATCDYTGSDVPFDFGTYSSVFIFVHKVGVTNTHENLALRYEGGGSYPWLWPKLTWKGPASLQITALEDITQVSKERTRVDGVSIQYSLGRADEPPMTFWDRLWNT